MKELLIARHAKSAWSDPALADFDRPLNERGERDAPDMGARLVRRKRVPQLVVASPARRALRTAQLLAAQCGIAARDIEIVDTLYEAGVGDWLAVIGSLPESIDRALIVGHNPTVTELANLLCPELRLENMPTCGLLYLRYAVQNWSALEDAVPQEHELDYPKRGAP